MAACSACSAIYNKVEAVTPQQTTPFPRPAVQLQRAHNFIDALRAEGNYPVFRNIANITFWFMQALALIALLAALASGLKSEWAVFFGGLVCTIFLHIFGRATKEAAHMIADLSDATVRIAERQERAS